MVRRLEFRKLAPHLYLQAIPSRVSDADLAAFLAELQAASPTLDRPHAWIADFAQIESATAMQRRMFAEHQIAVEAVDRAHNVGSAIIIPSPPKLGPAACSKRSSPKWSRLGVEIVTFTVAPPGRQPA